MAHAIFDEASLQNQVEGLKREQAEERRVNWAQNQMRNSSWIGAAIDPTNPMKRFGRPRLWSDVEKKLGELFPFLTFLDHPKIPHRRMCGVIHGPDGFLPIAFYDKIMLPEFTILQEHHEYVADPTLFALPGNRPENAIDSADVEARVAGVDDTGKTHWVDDRPPGVLDVVQPGEVLTAGWRYILAKLFLMGVGSPELFDQHFGSVDSVEWRGITGRGQKEVPW